MTDAQGRIADLSDGGINPGSYRLLFEVGPYFGSTPHLFETVALDLRQTLDHTARGNVPDVAPAFDKEGAAHDARLAAVRDSLVGTIKAAVTRSFRPALALCALLAALALVPVALLGRRSRA